MTGIELALSAITTFAAFGGAAATVIYARATSSEAKAKAESEALRHRLILAVREIEACHAEEELFCQELESLGVGSANSIKVEFRNRVETMGLTRPSWKPSRIKDELAWLEGGAPRLATARDRGLGTPQPKQAGPLQRVIAHHLDKALNGGENSGILPMHPPVIEGPAPRGVDGPTQAAGRVRRAAPDIEV